MVNIPFFFNVFCLLALFIPKIPLKKQLIKGKTLFKFNPVLLSLSGSYGKSKHLPHIYGAHSYLTVSTRLAKVYHFSLF